MVEVKERWWHRLLNIIFVVVMLLVSVLVAAIAYDESGEYIMSYSWHKDWEPGAGMEECSIEIYKRQREGEEFRTKPWSEVASSPQYMALSPQEREEARNEYFDQVVAPQLLDPEAVPDVRLVFDRDTAPKPDGSPAPNSSEASSANTRWAKYAEYEGIYGEVKCNLLTTPSEVLDDMVAAGYIQAESIPQRRTKAGDAFFLRKIWEKNPAHWRNFNKFRGERVQSSTIYGGVAIAFAFCILYGLRMLIIYIAHGPDVRIVE